LSKLGRSHAPWYHLNSRRQKRPRTRAPVTEGTRSGLPARRRFSRTAPGRRSRNTLTEAYTNRFLSWLAPRLYLPDHCRFLCVMGYHIVFRRLCQLQNTIFYTFSVFLKGSFSSGSIFQQISRTVWSLSETAPVVPFVPKLWKPMKFSGQGGGQSQGFIL